MEPTKKSNRALTGVIIVIIVLVLAFLFFLKRDKIEDSSTQEASYEENSPANNISSSDEVTDIEAELNSNADMDSLDAGLE